MAIATPVREISIDRLFGSSRTGVGGATDGVEDGTWDGGVLVMLGVGAGVIAGGVGAGVVGAGVVGPEVALVTGMGAIVT